MYKRQTLCQGKIKSTFLEDSWLGISTDRIDYEATDERGTITIELDQTSAFKTAYVNDQANVQNGDSTSRTFYAHLLGQGGVRVGEPIPLRYMEENNIVYLSGDFDLPGPVGGDGVYALEFYKYSAGGLVTPYNELLYGKYHLIHQEPVILAEEGDLSIPLVNGQDITVKENWPSGEKDVVYMISDKATILGYSYEGNATFQDPEHFVWSSSDRDIASIDPCTGEIHPGSKPGQVILTISATDGGYTPAGHNPASASLAVTVSAGGPPAVVVPENSNIAVSYTHLDVYKRQSLQSLLAQIENEGISILAEGAADPLEYTTVNHEIYIKATVGRFDGENFVEIPGNRINVDPWSVYDTSFFVRCELVDENGDALELEVNDPRLKGKGASFQWRIIGGSMQRDFTLPGAAIRGPSAQGETIYMDCLLYTSRCV